MKRFKRFRYTLQECSMLVRGVFRSVAPLICYIRETLESINNLIKDIREHPDKCLKVAMF